MIAGRAARVELAMLAAWVGAALLVSTVVAPAAFAVLPSRALAGTLVGRVLPVLFIGGMLVGVAGLAMEGVSGVALRKRGRLLALAFGGLACAMAQFVVTPRIAALRASMAVPVDSLPLTDPGRVAFGRMHGASVGLLGLAMVSAIVAVVLLVSAPDGAPPASSRPHSAA